MDTPRILFLSDSESLGGAGIAASRLARALHGAGCEVVRVTLFADPEPSGPWRTYRLEPDGAAPVAWSEVPNTAAEPLVLGALGDLLDEIEPDAVSVHNLHGGIKHGWSAEMAGLCASRAPTVWTMHDMWPFTGRCIYDDGCGRYVSGCKDCPAPDQYPFMPGPHLARAFGQKADAVAGSPRLGAACPSCWLAGEARKGLWKDSVVAAIPNPLDLERFRPRDRSESRKRLGIPGDRPVLLCAAADLSDPRKGMDLLVRALDGVRPVTLATMGKNGLESLPAHVRPHPAGFVADEETQALWYDAADLLVHPARCDNLPNTVAEAMACGTPCAAFDVGGLSEMVLPCGGILARDVTPEGLAAAIEQVLDTRSFGCRDQAMDRYDPADAARRYLELFRRLGASF